MLVVIVLALSNVCLALMLIRLYGGLRLVPIALRYAALIYEFIWCVFKRGLTVLICPVYWPCRWVVNLGIRNLVFLIRKLQILNHSVYGRYWLAASMPSDADVQVLAGDVVAEHEQVCIKHQKAYRVGRVARSTLKFDRYTNPHDNATRQLAESMCWQLLNDPEICPDMRRCDAVYLHPMAVEVCMTPSRQELLAYAASQTTTVFARFNEIRKERRVYVPYDGPFGAILAYVGIRRSVIAVPAVDYRPNF